MMMIASAFITREIAQIKGEIQEALENKITINDLLEPAILKPFLIAITMYFIMNLTGLNIMIFYCNTIFQYSGSSLNYNVASIIVAILLLISSFLAIIVITKLPRKIILVTSVVGMAVCYLILGACFHELEKGGFSAFDPKSSPYTESSPSHTSHHHCPQDGPYLCTTQAPTSKQ